MATVSELVLTAVRVASHQVSEGSRRNARQALEARHQSRRESADVLATLPAQRSADVPSEHRPSA